MELLTYALLKPIVPFLLFLALFGAGWALSDLAAWRLSGRERTFWTLAILLFPPLGSMLYGLMRKKTFTETEEVA